MDWKVSSQAISPFVSQHFPEAEQRVFFRWRSGVLSLSFSCCLGEDVHSRHLFFTGSKPPSFLSFFVFAPCLPPSNHNHPSWSATWVMTTPGTLSPQCHSCHWISCRLQLLHPPRPPPTIFCSLPTYKKAVEAALRKEKKIDQGSGKQKKKDVSKCFLCNNFYPSNTFLLKATLLGTQKWVLLFGNNSRRASEATVKLLRSRCFFLSPINLTPTPPLSSFVPALARQFLNGTRHACIVHLTYSEDEKCLCTSKEPQSRLNHQWGWVSAEKKKKKRRHRRRKYQKKTNTALQYEKTRWFLIFL